MMKWHEGKLYIEQSVTLSHDSLHVIFGTLIWLVAALLLRRPISSWVPWLCVLAVILWNESIDVWLEQWPNVKPLHGLRDVLLTMFVPTVLMAAARFRPNLFRPLSRSRRRT